MAKYFPYLRAKQFELIAVERVAASLAATAKITPIFEPVRVATGPLVTRAAALGTAGLAIALVMNPEVGELSGNHQATGQLLSAMRAAGATVIPALLVHGQLQPAEIQGLQSHRNGGPAIHLHVALPTPQAAAALQASPATTDLFADGATSASYQAGFSPRALLRDGFNAQVRNANYPAQSFFSDLHLTHAALGFAGFGDYAPIGAQFVEGGGPAYAVVIHMTEDRQQQGVLCNHFLSTSNTTTANPAGKFGQAVAALSAYSAANPGRIDFSNACQELLQHHTNGHFPGLGELKRLAIQHHLELMTTLV